MNGPIFVRRREVLQLASRVIAGLFGASLLTSCDSTDDTTPKPTPPTPTPTPTGPGDADYLNFALNLAYLEGQFYSFASKGTGLAPTLLQGVGATGTVDGGNQVPFMDGLLRQHCREIAGHTEAHVVVLRSVLGSAVIAQPDINIGSSPTGPFTSIARAAAIVGPAELFDPYGSTNNFLLSAFILSDVIVTMYNGLVGPVRSASIRSELHGLLAAKAYHAGLVRSTVQRLTTPSSVPLVDQTESLSAVRDDFDGGTDVDQGLRPISSVGNLVPTGPAGMTFSRTPGQILNILYLSRTSVDRGAFFPSGVNGSIRMSANN